MSFLLEVIYPLIQRLLLCCVLLASRASIIRIGNRIEKINPFFNSPPSASEIHPITVGPVVHPMSPATASSAKTVVDAFGMAFVVILIVPGHNADTESPHIAHPINETTAFGDRHAIKYDSMHKTDDKNK